MPALSPHHQLQLCLARWWQDPIFNKARWCTSGIVQQVQQFNNQVTCTANANMFAPPERMRCPRVHGSHASAGL